jgi:excisionase family DNA binding protein
LKGERRNVINPKVLKTKAAATYIGVGATKLRELVHAGKITYISDGDNTSALRFLVSDLDAYLSRCRIRSMADRMEAPATAQQMSMSGV